jgi:nucleotide-binding universal stress UspA family protein
VIIWAATRFVGSHAACQTFAIRVTISRFRRAARGLSRILCAIDLTAKSVGLIRSAKQLADSYGATLQVVHAATGWPEAIPQADQFRALVLDFAGKQIEKLQQQAGTTAEVQLRGGEVTHVVHRAALDFNADLVVIGRGVLQEPFGRLRIYAYAIIRRSPCPVLSV